MQDPPLCCNPCVIAVLYSSSVLYAERNLRTISFNKQMNVKLSEQIFPKTAHPTVKLHKNSP